MCPGNLKSCPGISLEIQGTLTDNRIPNFNSTANCCYCEFITIWRPRYDRDFFFVDSVERQEKWSPIFTPGGDCQNLRKYLLLVARSSDAAFWTEYQT